MKESAFLIRTFYDPFTDSLKEESLFLDSSLAFSLAYNSITALILIGASRFKFHNGSPVLTLLST